MAPTATILIYFIDYATRRCVQPIVCRYFGVMPLRELAVSYAYNRTIQNNVSDTKLAIPMFLFN